TDRTSRSRNRPCRVLRRPARVADPVVSFIDGWRADAVHSEYQKIQPRLAAAMNCGVTLDSALDQVSTSNARMPSWATTSKTVDGVRLPAVNHSRAVMVTMTRSPTGYKRRAANPLVSSIGLTRKLHVGIARPTARMIESSSASHDVRLSLRPTTMNSPTVPNP